MKRQVATAKAAVKAPPLAKATAPGRGAAPAQRAARTGSVVIGAGESNAVVQRIFGGGRAKRHVVAH